MMEDGEKTLIVIVIFLVCVTCFMIGISLIWIWRNKFHKILLDDNQEELADLCLGPFPCYVCQEKYQTSIELLKHQKENHFLCKICQQAFKHNSDTNESKHDCYYRHWKVFTKCHNAYQWFASSPLQYIYVDSLIILFGLFWSENTK